MRSFSSFHLFTSRLDKYSIFEEEVTDKEAPGYSDVVKFPMDLGKMRAKVKNGDYGVGSAAATAFYKGEFHNELQSVWVVVE